jgi:kinesin family protein 11
VSDDNYQEMTDTLDAQKLELEEINERLQTLQQAKDDLQTLFASTAATLTTTQSQLEETATELATASAELEHTRAELQVTALERDQTHFISTQQAATEDTLRQQAESLVGVAETTTQHVEGLHAKIGRKSAVEAHNVTASQQLEQSVKSQVEASKQGLQAFQQQHHANLTASASVMQEFANKVSDNMTSLTAAVRKAILYAMQRAYSSTCRWSKRKCSWAAIVKPLSTA